MASAFHPQQQGLKLFNDRRDQLFRPGFSVPSTTTRIETHVLEYHQYSPRMASAFHPQQQGLKPSDWSTGMAAVGRLQRSIHNNKD